MISPEVSMPILITFSLFYSAMEGLREGVHYRFKHAVRHSLIESDKNLKMINAITFMTFVTMVTWLSGLWQLIPLHLAARKILLDGVQNKMINPNLSFFRVSRSGRAATDNLIVFISDRISILTPKVIKLSVLVASILFAIFTR